MLQGKHNLLDCRIEGAHLVLSVSYKKREEINRNIVNHYTTSVSTEDEEPVREFKTTETLSLIVFPIKAIEGFTMQRTSTLVESSTGASSHVKNSIQFNEGHEHYLPINEIYGEEEQIEKLRELLSSYLEIEYNYSTKE